MTLKQHNMKTQLTKHCCCVVCCGTVSNGVTLREGCLSLGHSKSISCFLDRIKVGTGSVGRQKKKKKLI